MKRFSQYEEEPWGEGLPRAHSWHLCILHNYKRFTPDSKNISTKNKSVNKYDMRENDLDIHL